MAQTITTDLKKSLEAPVVPYKRAVNLYRRTWGGSSYSFDTALDISDLLVGASPVNWKMDKEGFNVWNLDNATLTFRNDKNQFLQDNPAGYFESHLLYGSKIEIAAGTALSDGSTEEKPYLFTGFINEDPIYNSEEKTVDITIAGRMYIFDNFSAEDISTTVTDELLGSDSGTEFTTANVGCAPAITVKRGATIDGAGSATELKVGIDYEVSGQDTYNTALTITLTDALTSGNSLWIDYKYWYTDKAIEWVVEQICTNCGVTDTRITPANFEVDLETTQTVTDKADWDLGTVLTNLDTSGKDGSIWQDWKLISSSFTPRFGPVFNFSKSVGYWVFTFSQFAAAGSGIITYFYTYLGSGYTLLYLFDGQSSGTAYFYRNSSPVIAIGVWTFRFPVGAGTKGPFGIKILRKSDGAWYIWENDVLKVNGAIDNYATDFAYTSFYSTCTSFQFNNVSNFYIGNSTDETTYTDDYVTIASSSPVYESKVFDNGSSITSYGIFDSVYDNGTGTISFYTYSSDTSDFSSGNDPAGWVSVLPTGTIQSAVKRYIKFKIEMTEPSTNNQGDFPFVDNVVFYSYVDTVRIEFVRLTGLTCRQALEELAKLCCYEIGFDASGYFVFRPRQTTTPAVIELDGDVNIRAVESVTPGIDRVYNEVAAEFGIYTKISSASTDSQPNSIDKYGTKRYTVSSSTLLPAENVNLAYAVAPTILAYTKEPRLRARVSCRFYPHLELGDNVTITYKNPTAFKDWKWGSYDVAYGDTDIFYYEGDASLRLMLYEKTMRIEGIELNFTDEWSMTLDLVEVL